MSRSVLLSCESISKAYGAQSLFRGLSFGLCEGDRVGLVGPNGSGKSTLLKILAGMETPDSGTRSVRRLTRVGYVPQEPVFPSGRTVEEILYEALGEATLDDFDRAGKVAVALGRAGFTDFRQPVEMLSGGWTKRLAIARELVQSPAILLLDEPTNHLDVEGILWLEEVLQSESLACLVVSHDRYFLEHVATRMVELNRAYPEGIFETDGRYSDFLTKRDEAFRNQAAYQESLANMVRRELEWLRRGAKARSTKAQARIKEAGRLKQELDEMKARSVSGAVGIDFTSSERQSKKLLVTRKLKKSFGQKLVLDGIDLTLTPGLRLGLLGPNGSGKSTLLRLLTGEIMPEAGEIERAEELRIVYFDQNREALDPNLSLKRALIPDGDTVLYRGRPIHVASWAKRFLFRADQLELPMQWLSGGEQARVLIARLMLQPADLLILDEPTNDLDIPTLEVLEESLTDFPGCVVLVTHDRFLLDRVSTLLLALDGSGRGVFFADYAQWEAAHLRAASVFRQPASKSPPRETRPTPRFSSREKREWEQIEQKISEAEEMLTERQQALEDPAVASDPAALQQRYEALAAARAAVETLYARWAELEEKVHGR
ncbi:MAG: ABC-F family ATP-binding cassette domain-containing protein [Deltaproteobacteria bacterium]|nr:ABC-F family ATP-binding cassette domain-containing protein [Deltaproteobacteria bacterium]